ncbi:MAG: IclR family transcriptional regulator [Opitutaceae bacterium]|nr:IclR family transcriptional regulator [Opitutaceae bacterium]
MQKKSKNQKSSALNESQYRAPALEKGLDILELLADQSDGLSQVGIAKKLDRSVSEIFRMLNCLQERGYITLHKPADTYTLTLKLFELSHRNLPMRRLVEEAQPHIREIVRKLNQSCHISVYHDNRMLVMAQADNPGSLGFSVRVGAELDALDTASGLVMLAYRSDSEREEMLSVRLDSQSRTVDMKELNNICAQIREKGYEECPSHQIAGVLNISFPIMDFSGAVIAALAVPYIRRIDKDSSVSPAKIRAVLRDYARRISQAIGAP